MKAIIKFLPIEGDIKMGSYSRCTFLKENRSSVGIWQSDEQPVNSKFMAFEKVEPFVVTEDIKVGEIVIDEEGHKGMCMEIKVTGLSVLWDGKSIHVKNCFKILGGVSPESEFVEDGEEYEIVIWLNKKDVSRYEGFKEYEFERQKYYKIKCPTCNHFH